MQRFLLAILLFTGGLFPVFAVQINNTGTITYQTTQPTNSDISGWTTGWGTTGITGWDYVGQVNGASAVYLGNNWVITAAHVSAGAFTLNSVTYSLVNGSQQSLTSVLGTGDLIMFQIATAPTLPSLTVASLDPTVGSDVVILGYGGNPNKTWGVNTVSNTNLSVIVSGHPYNSVDFETDYGSSNMAILVGGDSGGGDFIYNSSPGANRWEIAGINEAVDPSTSDSYFVQFSAYSGQINGLLATPEPGTWSLVLLALALGGIGKFIRSRRPPSVP